MISTYSSDIQMPRESRTPVRLPDRRPDALFPGWGPKF